MVTSYDKIYLRVGIPAALEGVFMILLSNADIIMVGSLGTAAIAAVSIFTQPRMVLLTVVPLPPPSLCSLRSGLADNRATATAM